jgi:YidC/Oxa1 family membrane protein insertase
VNALIALIATPVATVLKAIHSFLSLFLQPSSGPAWGLSIVLLTVCVRLVLFPLFVKQIKSQRRMQELAPKIKELQAKHKGDRETMNVELMKLYKDNNANPISGCLPLILQLPVFFALFSVIREFKPGASAKYGLSASDLLEGGKAKIFGAPISAAFNSPSSLLHQLGGSGTTGKAVALIMIVLMGATTFWTQRQMMARAGAAVDKQQQQIQKFMLYVLPLSFAVFGINFPVGVLLYWLTTNLWSMGQQAWVIKRMPPVVVGATPALSTKPAEGRRGLFGGRAPKAIDAAGDTTDTTEAPVSDEPPVATAPRPSTSPAPAGGGQSSRRAAGTRKNKKRGRR